MSGYKIFMLKYVLSFYVENAKIENSWNDLWKFWNVPRNDARTFFKRKNSEKMRRFFWF